MPRSKKGKTKENIHCQALVSVVNGVLNGKPMINDHYVLVDVELELDVEKTLYQVEKVIKI